MAELAGRVTSRGQTLEYAERVFIMIYCDISRHWDYNVLVLCID